LGGRGHSPVCAGDNLIGKIDQSTLRWSQSVVQAGLSAGFHFYDLRQPGSGKRRQHPRADAPHGPRQHARCTDLPAPTGERNREIADASNLRIERELEEMGPIKGPRLGVDGSSLGQAPSKQRDV
jgi:hypothetical protein